MSSRTNGYRNAGFTNKSDETHAGAGFRLSQRGVLVLLLLLINVVSPGRAEAGNTPNSVPQSVLNAKSVYVENLTTDAQLQTAIYADLTKWGRYQIVDATQKADLILRLSNGNIVRFVSGDAANSPATETKAANSAPPAADESVPPGFTRITLVDPKTGNPLWSGLRKTSGSPATWHLLDGLREAIEKSRNTK